MYLVLCDAKDYSALWAYQGLQKLGLEPIELVTPEMLVLCLKWEHRLEGLETYTSIQLADGRALYSGEIQGVLNRVQDAPIFHLRKASQADQNYAHEELQAFFLSWINGLDCPVLNRPRPYGLSGQWRHESKWVWMAASAGLSTATYRESSHAAAAFPGRQSQLLAPGAVPKTLIAVGGRVFGPRAPAGVEAGCRKLAQVAGEALLGIDFTEGESGPWTFAGAMPHPDLTAGGEALLSTLAALLRKEIGAV
jgi:hypothetical protein